MDLPLICEDHQPNRSSSYRHTKEHQRPSTSPAQSDCNNPHSGLRISWPMAASLKVHQWKRPIHRAALLTSDNLPYLLIVWNVTPAEQLVVRFPYDSWDRSISANDGMARSNPLDRSECPASNVINSAIDSLIATWRSSASCCRRLVRYTDSNEPVNSQTSRMAGDTTRGVSW